MIGRLDRLALLIPGLFAGVTSLVLLAIATVRGDGTITIVAALGVVIAGCLTLVAESQERASRRVEARLDELGAAFAATENRLLHSHTRVQEGTTALERMIAVLAREHERTGLDAQVIGRDDFYDMACALVANPPDDFRVVRVFNMFGPRPHEDSVDARSRWFKTITSPEFAQSSPPTIKRVKLIGDEASFQWTLRSLVAGSGNREFHIGAIHSIMLDGVSPLLYPLNAHTYYRQHAFILCPGFSARTSGADDSVIHLTSREAIDRLSAYHDRVFESSIVLLAGGEIDVERCRYLARVLGMESDLTHELLDALPASRHGV